RDLAERDMDPEVLVASGQGITQCVARALRIALLPQLQPFMIIQLGLADSTGMDQLEGVAVNQGEADRSAARFPGPASWSSRARRPGSSGTSSRPRPT